MVAQFVLIFPFSALLKKRRGEERRGELWQLQVEQATFSPAIGKKKKHSQCLTQTPLKTEHMIKVR